MKKSIYTILTFTKLNTRRFFRDTLALFFTIGFPLIFLLVFGFLSKGGDVSFKVAIINQSTTAYAKQYVKDAHSNKLYKIDDSVTTQAKAEEKMKRSQIDATIILPTSFGALSDAKYSIPATTSRLLKRSARYSRPSSNSPTPSLYRLWSRSKS
jgi:ABC-2 type transport system permease protein